MSQADELLKSLNEGIAVASVDPETEPHIVIDNDRNITVPDELRRIAVQYDHNIETVTFDCPRYWDGHDLSEMTIYINYMRSDKTKGFTLADNITVDENDPSIMHFTWTISKNVTMDDGAVSFLVCAKKVDLEGNEEYTWNSELSNQINVSEGLDCYESVAENYPDIYTKIIQAAESSIFTEADRYQINENTTNIGIHSQEISYLENNVNSISTGLTATVNRVNDIENNFDNYYTKDEVFNKEQINYQLEGIGAEIDELSKKEVDLSNYYTKDEVFTKGQINYQLEGIGGEIDAINTSIDTLETTVDELSKKEVDLSNYYTKDEVFTKGQINYQLEGIGAEIDTINTSIDTLETGVEEALGRNEFTDAEKSKLAGITNPMIIKGRVDSVTNLPSNAETGWFYFVGVENAESFDEYCYGERGWEMVGTTTTSVDLSDYYTKGQVDTKFTEVNNDITELTTRANANDTVVGNLSNSLQNAVFKSNVDSELSTTSTNPIQNKAIATRVEALDSQVTQLQGKVQGNIDDISELQNDGSVYEMTLGYRSKNLFKITSTSNTVNGVTFTVNDNGTITANGTATANTFYELKPNLYIQDKNWAGNIFSTGVIAQDKSYRGVVSYYDSSWTNIETVYMNGTDHVLLNHYCATAAIFIQAGTTVNNVVFEPMIRRSYDKDGTYEPYGGEDVNTRLNVLSANIEELQGGGSVDLSNYYTKDEVFNKSQINYQLDGIGAEIDANTAAIEELQSGGSGDLSELKETMLYHEDTIGYRVKNLLNITVNDAEYKGVTITNNHDGTLTLTGTATEDFYIPLCTASLEPNTTYIISDKGNATSGSTYHFAAYYSGQYIGTTHDNPIFTTSADQTYIQLHLCMSKGYTISLVANPMLRKAYVTDDTFEPYVGTVDERLCKLENPGNVNRFSEFDYSTMSADLALLLGKDSIIYKCGNVVNMQMAFFARSSLSGGSFYMVGNLPESLQPLLNVSKYVAYYNNRICGIISIYGGNDVYAGKVMFMPHDNMSAGSASYPVDFAITYLAKN